MNMTLLLVAGGIVFLFGLLQWARSGALLWDIHQLLKFSQPSSTAQTEMDRKEVAREKESLQKTVQNMERSMDVFLKSSLKILGILALCVWIFVVAVVVMDMLNLDWLDMHGFSSNRVLGAPSARSSFNSGSTGSAGRDRSTMLRHLGSGIRR